MALIPAVPLRAIFDFAYAGHETVDVSTVTADRVKQFLDTGEKILLIDLLPTKEFAQKRIPGARSIPMADLHNRLAEVAKSGRVIFYAADPQNEISTRHFNLWTKWISERGHDGRRFSGMVKRKYPLETEIKNQYCRNAWNRIRCNTLKTIGFGDLSI